MQAIQPVSEMRQVVAVITDTLPKCWNCRRTLGGFFTRPWELVCRKCHAVNSSARYRLR